MKVVWSSLVKFPPLCKVEGEPAPNHCGWMFSAAKALLKYFPETKLVVIIYSQCKELSQHDIDGIRYYEIPMPSKSYNKILSKVYPSTVEFCRLVLEREKPDVIHAHGTEYALSYALLLAAEKRGLKKKTAISIQGLASVYARYVYGGISSFALWKNLSLFDFITLRWPFVNRLSMLKRGRLEYKCINIAKHVIGRTDWDYAHTRVINKNSIYHVCHEVMRDSFYYGRWSYNCCKQHTIFVSNCSVPLKGAHNVIKAINMVKECIPDVQVRLVGGINREDSWFKRLRLNTYQKYLHNLIIRNNLHESVHFLGSLTETEMKNEFLRCQLYILPSAIENSPNSLCEALMLGVPTLAAYRGGIPSLVKENKDIELYNYEDVEMLAIKIIERLENRHNLINAKGSSRSLICKRHNPKSVAETLRQIYEEISI